MPGCDASLTIALRGGPSTVRNPGISDAGIRQRDNTGIGGPEVIRCSHRAGGAPTRRIGDRDPVKNIEKLLAPAAAPGYNQARRP